MKQEKIKEMIANIYKKAEIAGYDKDRVKNRIDAIFSSPLAIHDTRYDCYVRFKNSLGNIVCGGGFFVDTDFYDAIMGFYIELKGY